MEKIKIFEDYIKKYDDDKSKEKTFISKTTMKYATNLAESLGLMPSEIELIKTISLVYDIGKFESNEYIKEITKNILFERNLIDIFDKERRNQIENVIEKIYQDKINESYDNLNLYAMIVRDSITLSNLFMLANNDRNIVKGKDSINDIVKELFLINERINSVDVKSESDDILRQLSGIYDFNFESSYDYVKQNSLLNMIYARINDKKNFKDYFVHLDKFVEEKNETRHY